MPYPWPQNPQPLLSALLPQPQKKSFKTVDGIEICPQMIVYIYPANCKRCGTIKEKIVQSVDDWTIRCTDNTRVWNRNRAGHPKIYALQQSAIDQKEKDKAEPPWMRGGKFTLKNCNDVIAFLSAKSGLPSNKITASKTANELHVIWVNNEGTLDKAKIGLKLYSLSEESFKSVFRKNDACSLSRS